MKKLTLIVLLFISLCFSCSDPLPICHDNSVCSGTYSPYACQIEDFRADTSINLRYLDLQCQCELDFDSIDFKIGMDSLILTALEELTIDCIPPSGLPIMKNIKTLNQSKHFIFPNLDKMPHLEILNAINPTETIASSDCTDPILSSIFPIETYNCTHLKEINISGILFQDFPIGMTNLGQLEVLKITNNICLTNLPTMLPSSLKEINISASFRKSLNLSNLNFLNQPLPNLESLKISRAPLITNLPSTINNCQNLKYLNIFGNLNSLPASIGDLSQLELLALNHNNLTALPASISNLSQLKQLYLIGNDLTNFPTSIGNLPQLQELYLSYNHLSILNNSLANLPALKKLVIEHNQLVNIDNSIGGMTNLKWIYADNNQIISLSEAIGNLSNLLEIYLEDNQLSDLPSSIIHCDELTKMILKNNSFSIIPDEVEYMDDLSFLDLSYNFISSFPSSFSIIAEIETVDLSNNHLTDLDFTTFGISSIERLILANNNITTITPNIADLSNSLDLLDLTGNPIDSTTLSQLNIWLPSTEILVD